MGKIAEILVRREYEKQGKKLPDKFWLLPEYKRKYAMQCMMASKFLRSYDQDVILAVLEQEKWCYSLAAKVLAEKFEIEKNKRRIQAQMKERAQKNKAEDTPAQENLPEFRTKNGKTFKEDE